MTVEETGYFTLDPVEVPEIGKNRLQMEPTDILRSRSNDPINWQPWSPELLTYAEQTQRPIFAFVFSGKHPSAISFLDDFSDPDNGFVDIFNENYVCTLVDIEAHPEISVLSAVLSREIRKPLSFPFLLWLSHEGNPIGWVPVQRHEREEFERILQASHTLVSNTWEESQSYSVTNSRLDNIQRLKRNELIVHEEVPTEEDYTKLLVEQTSRLSSLYDPATQVIDGSGGLLPTGFLLYLAQVSDLPEIPNYLRNRCLRILKKIPALLASQPITDPLDNGVFASRKSKDWSIPVFTKSLKTQSEMIMVYSFAYSLHKDPSFADLAVKTQAFTDAEFGQERNGVGAFKALRDEEFSSELFVVSLADYQESLSDEELKVLRSVSLLSPEGNISSEVDPRRKYFRKNILGNFIPLQAVASELALSEEEVSTLLQSARKKLAVWRRQRADELDAFVTESTRITEVNALHAQALFQSGALLGRPDNLIEGRSLLKLLRQEHYDQLKGLWRIAPSDGRRGVKARGRDYACLIAALLEAYRVELNPADLVWAEALARESLRTLKNENSLILEAPQEEILGQFPLYGHTMILGDSTWGSLLSSYEYLDRVAIKSPFAECSEAIVNRLYESAKRAPMNHSDYLRSLLVPLTDCVAVVHGERDNPLVAQLHQHLLQPKYRGLVLLRSDILEKTNFINFSSVPSEPGVTLYRSERKIGTASTLEALDTLLGTALEPR